MKKINSLFIKSILMICFLTTALFSSAKTRINLVSFNFPSPTAPTVGTSLLSDLTITNITTKGATEKITANTNYGATVWLSSSFNTANSDYMEFTLTPKNGLDIICDSIAATYKRVALAPENMQIVISKDNFSSSATLYQTLNFPAATLTAINTSVPTSFHVANNETARVRIYAWSTTGSLSGLLSFTKLVLKGTATTPTKPKPTSHVTNLTSVIAAPNNSVTLTWTDVADADSYLIKTTSFIPKDGVVESDSATIVKIVNKGVQTVTLTPFCDNTSFTFSIYPFNNIGTDVKYNTDGLVPTTTVVTPTETIASIFNCIDGRKQPNKTDNVWVSGYIVGFVQTVDPFTVNVQPGTSVMDALPLGAFGNVLLADNAMETDTAKMFYVKLSEAYMQRMINLKINFSNLNRQISVKGKVNPNLIGTLNHLGITNLYNYRWASPSAVTNTFSEKIKISVNGNEISVSELQSKLVVSLFDLQGKRIKQLNADGNEVRIKVDTKGIYVLSVVGEKGRFTQKVVIL